MLGIIGRKIRNLLTGNGVTEQGRGNVPAAGRSSSQPANRIKAKPHQPGEKTKPREAHRKTIRDKKTAGKSPGKVPVIIEHKKKLPPKPEKLIIYPEQEGKTRFTDFALHEDILFGMQEMGFQYCTPIQTKSLPFLLTGRDTAGKAQTGTGKTAAFLAAIFNKFLNEPEAGRKPGTCRALILAPTRELAMQIYRDAENISRFTQMNNVVVFGGMDHRKQRDLLDKPIDVLIGTPGRVIDYSSSRHLNLAGTEVLVLDEADRMLDMGFIPDVRRIIGRLPGKEKRQTLLYSATLDDKILRLAHAWLRDPVQVEGETDKLVTDLIEQNFYTVAIDEKFAVLYWIINNEHYDRMLIFGNLKTRNYDLYRRLKHHGIGCDLLSGDIPQPKRLKILEDFRSGRQKIVIATDVAARGIHVDNVSIVINYDLPERAEDYVHRIGRTGRAGKTGKSISFVCEYGAYSLVMIEKMLGEPVKCVLPPDEMLAPPPGLRNHARVPEQKPADRRRRAGRSRTYRN
ncbi:MAG: DEAD/DEAH box helicase [Victivallaceae bacterium]|nr:DEAD/DEAH box helicase [Victivallaceae bacterium]